MPTTVFNDSNLSFLQNQWTYEQQSPPQVFNFLAGNASSPQSSNSSESSSSSYHEESRSPIRSPDTTTEDISGGPFLQILEEPNDKFRFRYKTEMQGTHGAILGINAQKSKSKKTFPKVKLCNYASNSGKDPIIRCTLYTADENIDKRVAHVHKLIGKDNGDEQDDPHDVVISSPHYTAFFRNMTILFTKKEDQEKVLMEKKQAHIKRRFTDSRQFKVLDKSKLRMKVLEELSNINLNVACLRFEALIDNGQGMYTPLCPPVYSKPINNMKNAQTNELRICRVDRCSGSCLGGEEVFMFVEKVVKKNIKVKFFEEGPNKEILWSDYALFTQDDVHHQYGIAFRTPPYRDPNITNDVEVYFQLERPSDKAVSDPMIFEYHPNPNRHRDMHRKRPRQDSTSNLPTMLNDFIEKPRTWNQETVSSSQITSANTSDIPSVAAALSGLYDSIDDFSEIMKDMIQNPMELQEGFIEEMTSLTSSDWSFDKTFGNIPSADSEAISQFLNSGRLQDYAMLNGEEEAAQMLMSGQIPLASRDLVFDGISKLLGQSKIAYPPSNTLNSSMPSDLTTSNQKGPKDKSTKDMNIPLSHIDPINSTPARDEKTKLLLTESNIVEKTEKALSDLLKLKHRRKISGQLFQTFLRRLFSYTVLDTEDSVLHVLAASNQNTVPVQASRFINMLKISNIINNVIDSLNCNQETPLHVAASKGSVDIVSLLLESGANVDATDCKHNTALHLAILRDSESMDIVAMLLSRHPNLSIYNVDGYNVCHLAVNKRKSDVLSSLLIKSEETEEYMYSEDLINKPDRKRGNTALHIAVENRFKEVVKLLLNFEEKIDVNAKNFDGKTPLAFVLGENDPDSKDIADQLLKKKADLTLVDLFNSDKKDEYKNEFDLEPDLEIVDDYVDESESAYAREWGDNNDLFDKMTISKLCPLLDNNDNWKDLFQRLKFTESEIDFCKIHWSPTLCAFKMAVLKKPEITAEVVRDELMMLAPRLQYGVELIDDMLLQRWASVETSVGPKVSIL